MNTFTIKYGYIENSDKHCLEKKPEFRSEMTVEAETLKDAVVVVKELACNREGYTFTTIF